MKKSLISAIIVALPFIGAAQTAIEGYQLSRYDLKGTARFVSMGGAFGALGGDISTLNQNPGGIGLYRKSEIGLTLSLNTQSNKSISIDYETKQGKTTFTADNFGYVGSIYTGSSVLPYFNWGASYTRVASFDRHYRGQSSMMGSLSNYIAGYTSGWSSDYLTNDNANYFGDNQVPWLSILAYNAFMINPVGTGNYGGIWKNGTSGVSTFDVVEKGHIDEYSINFGGNFNDIVYWGLGFGITDIDYRQNTYYTEDVENGRVASPQWVDDSRGGYFTSNGTGNGWGGFGLNSYKHISGTGFNVKMGVIIRPINELRLGFSIHTPTYYSLTQTLWGEVDWGYEGTTPGHTNDQYAGTPNDYLDYKFRTPWRMMLSAAGILGSKAIVSADYEYRPYQNMKYSNCGGYQAQADLNSDIKTYYNATSILRLGAEYRLSEHFSVRAGYSYETTPTTTEFRENSTTVFTSNPYDSGVTPSYTTDNSTQYITCGLGYRYKNFSIDAAFVHKSTESVFHAFTSQNNLDSQYGGNYAGADPYSAKLNYANNNIVLSVGLKF